MDWATEIKEAVRVFLWYGGAEVRESVPVTTSACWGVKTLAMTTVNLVQVNAPADHEIQPFRFV